MWERPAGRALYDVLDTRPVVLLGSTGSIGVNTLRIIEKHPDLFQVVALAGGRNVERLIVHSRTQ